jgi:hypothetical protein
VASGVAALLVIVAASPLAVLPDLPAALLRGAEAA